MGKNGDSEISGVQKAAILLIALGPEKSSQIFKPFCAGSSAALAFGQSFRWTDTP